MLEDFSSPALPFLDYSIDPENGELTLRNQVDDLYRYPDLTAQCEATFAWLEKAIEEGLVQEIEFLRRFDRLRSKMRNVVEMPDKKEQLFIRLCLHNHGHLAKKKRRLFAELDDDTVAKLEAIVGAEVSENVMSLAQ
ncbi:MAG TPA: hypothetical protein ENK31_09555 [Nannocystis exedens]|nr:hypothetical protein [Nannocystis exedens]